jgi:alkylhydroperoxidase family enzyme
VDGSDRVEAVLADLATAPIEEPLRAMLAFLRKLTREHDQLVPEDVASLLALGVTRSQIEDALGIAFSFNVINRLADTFGFEVGPPGSIEASAKALLNRGYL